MKKMGSLVAKPIRRRREDAPTREALERLAARASKQPREINALENLAYYLNVIPRMNHPGTAKGWRKAEGIITAWLSGTTASMRQALDEFNEWAARKPVPLYVQPEDAGFQTKELRVGMSGVVRNRLAPERITLWLLSEMFFKNEKRDRLKRCPECERWFVDKTRNGSMLRCSTSCTNKWWTIERRREARHRLPKSTRQAKRRATA